MSNMTTVTVNENPEEMKQEEAAKLTAYQAEEKARIEREIEEAWAQHDREQEEQEEPPDNSAKEIEEFYSSGGFSDAES